MFFAILTFIAAFSIEALGTVISVLGLSSLFSANPVIVSLAIALDVGKVVTVSFLYKKWATAPRALKYYMLVAAIVLMVISSAGAAGYLSAEFQQAITGTQQQEVVVNALKEEQVKLETRKKEIDAQIANLPTESVKGRQRLMDSFKSETDHINVRLVEISDELPKLKVKQIETNAHAGPIIYVAAAFNISVEQAVKWVILLIISVFNPLAVALLVTGNYLWENREQSKPIEKDDGEPNIIESAFGQWSPSEPVIRPNDVCVHHDEPAPPVTERSEAEIADWLNTELRSEHNNWLSEEYISSIINDAVSKIDNEARQAEVDAKRPEALKELLAEPAMEEVEVYEPIEVRVADASQLQLKEISVGEVLDLLSKNGTEAELDEVIAEQTAQPEHLSPEEVEALLQPVTGEDLDAEQILAEEHAQEPTLPPLVDQQKIIYVEDAHEYRLDKSRVHSVSGFNGIDSNKADIVLDVNQQKDSVIKKDYAS